MNTASGLTGVLLLCLARSVTLMSHDQPTYTDVQTLRPAVTGTILTYNVSNAPQAPQTPTFQLRNSLEDGPDPYVKYSQPAVYVLAQDMNDILEALKFGLNNSLRTAVMGAGHQFMGVQLLPNGLTIDTSNCTAVDVDPDSQTAYVQAGASGADLIAETEPYNLMWPTAHGSTIGVAGMVLGGGLGIGGSLYGASADSVLGIDVVSSWQDNISDWDIVRVNATSYPDLFWGLLGGGAMLATAVGFELQLHPIPADGLMSGVTAIWPLQSAVQAFQWYNDWLETAPPELDTDFAMITVPSLGQVVAVGVTNWDPNNSTDIIQAVQGFIAGALEAGAIEAAPAALTLTGILESYDADVLSGSAANYISDRFLQSIPEDLVATLVALYSNATSPYSTILIEAPVRDLGGSNNSDTAFGYRGEWYVEVWPFWVRTAGGAAVDGDAEHVEWANQGGDILDQYSQAHYINNNRFDSADSSETCFPAPNWARLQQLKAMYDPHGLFRPLDYFRTDNGFSGIAGDSDYY